MKCKLENPAEIYISRYCPTSPRYTTPFREFVAAFKQWLSQYAPRQVKEWTGPRLAQELYHYRLMVTYEGGRTVVKGIRPQYSSRVLKSGPDPKAE